MPNELRPIRKVEAETIKRAAYQDPNMRRAIKSAKLEGGEKMTYREKVGAITDRLKAEKRVSGQEKLLQSTWGLGRKLADKVTGKIWGAEVSPKKVMMSYLKVKNKMRKDISPSLEVKIKEQLALGKHPTVVLKWAQKEFEKKAKMNIRAAKITDALNNDKEKVGGVSAQPLGGKIGVQGEQSGQASSRDNSAGATASVNQGGSVVSGIHDKGKKGEEKPEAKKPQPLNPHMKLN